MNSNNNKFLTPKERDVCCTPEGGNTPENGGAGCIEGWKEELKKATNAFEEASAAAQKAEGLYANALTWEMKLKRWHDNAEDAHNLAAGILSELTLFLSAVEDIAKENTKKTTEAVEVLLCLVKKIFFQVVMLLKISPPAPAGEEGLIQKLKHAVDCLSDLSDQNKQEIMACIKVYEEKVQVVYGLQKDTLLKLLELLSCCEWLMVAIGWDSGLKGQLQNLKGRILGETSHIEILDACQKQVQKTDEDPNPKPPCRIEVLDNGKGLFPIKQYDDYPNNGPSEYWEKIEKLHEDAETDSKQKMKELNDARAIRDKALSLKISYTEAIKAAEKAEAAK